MIRGQKNVKSQESWEGMKAEYSAAKTGRFRRRRQVPASGAGADYHYRSEGDFLRIMEYARDMDRNDAIVGQMVDRAVANIIQGGLSPDPQTGDDQLDQAIKDRWWAWASDPRQCSHDGEHTYRDLEKLSLRHMFVDGDCFDVLTDEGKLQPIEAHRCRTPRATKRNVVHGVMLDSRRRRTEYWFTKDDIDPMASVARVSDITPVDAFATDEAGEYRAVLHLRNPKRFTQTRGVSAFAPVFDLLGMHEDLNFAKLVQQQVASCIAILRNRDPNFKGGSVDPYGPQTADDAAKRLIEELAPGMELRGLAGETISGFSPAIPNSEFFQQMRTILQLIGLNLGMPLVLMMLDGAETNFSGWRGAMDGARQGFMDIQGHVIDRRERPIYLWKLRDFAREDRAMRAAAASGKLFLHEWNSPRWKYVQPLQDAQADEKRQQRLLASPRRIHGDLGQDWNDTVKETVEDHAFAILLAIKKAKEISDGTGERITWREVLFMTDPEMLAKVTASVSTGKDGAAVPSAEKAFLNGAQILSLVDVFGKLRSGTIAPAAAKELLVAVGLDEARAQRAINATPAGAGGAEADRDFLRQILVALVNNPATVALVANSLTIGTAKGIAAGAGVPTNQAYDEPYVPVVAPAGNLVGGETIKDGEGTIVGGGVIEGSNAAAPQGSGDRVQGSGAGNPPEGGTPSDKETGDAK